MAIEPASLLIGLREGLEALLILGILMGMLRRLGHMEKRRQVWLGALGGVVAAVAAGLLVEAVFRTWFEDTGAAVFEIIVALAAVGILTYMVLWMQKHTTQLLDTVKKHVHEATATGRWGLLAALAFFTVFREGIEVVLFYAARSADYGWGTLIVSGLVGFLISAVIAYAIFRLTVQVSLRAFFGITGGLLVLVAGGLLIHVVHAMSDLGWISRGRPLWDTSGALPDDGHWLGGPLHALVGYVAQPSLLQLLAYLGYVVGVGGWYLASLLAPERRRRGRVVATSALVLMLTGFALAGALADSTEEAPTHGHGSVLYTEGPPEHLDHKLITAEASALLAETDLKVGLLVRSHGEPIHYNASTYESFKEFIRGIWPYTGLPEELLTVDHGTVLVDKDHPFSPDLHTDAALMDAWLTDYGLPAVPYDDGEDGLAESLADGPVWLAPGTGPGLGEPDIFEMTGIGAWRTWLKMDNHSPKVEQTEEHFAWLQEHLENHFGDQITVAFAHHIDPKVGEHRTLEGAAKRLADMDLILDSYHSSVHSDAMNTCMMQGHARKALKDAGFSGTLVPVGMAGTHPAWGEAVAAYLAEEADHFEGENVSIHLAQHGGRPGSPNPCGPEGSTDQYHANLDEQFQVTAGVLEDHFGDRFTLRHVYGQGASKPDDGELSPLEAIALDQQDGIGHAVIIPYEFWSDAMDNLVPLRESLGYTPDEAPYYDGAYETHLTIEGVHIDVWSAHYGIHEKGTAQLARISEALVAALE